MVTFIVDVMWALGDGEDFPAGRYSRSHTIRFDGGATIDASASPHMVGVWADDAAIDPEEMLVAALSNCHMLCFLHAARHAGLIVESYNDRAEGMMGEIAPGRLAVTRVVLQPDIAWRGTAPDKARIDHLHHEAHQACFIANSVKTQVTVA